MADPRGCGAGFEFISLFNRLSSSNNQVSMHMRVLRCVTCTLLTVIVSTTSPLPSHSFTGYHLPPASWDGGCYF